LLFLRSFPSSPSAPAPVSSRDPSLTLRPCRSPCTPSTASPSSSFHDSSPVSLPSSLGSLPLPPLLPPPLEEAHPRPKQLLPPSPSRRTSRSRTARGSRSCRRGRRRGTGGCSIRRRSRRLEQRWRGSNEEYVMSSLRIVVSCSCVFSLKAGEERDRNGDTGCSASSDGLSKTCRSSLRALLFVRGRTTKFVSTASPSRSEGQLSTAGVSRSLDFPRWLLHRHNSS
jgi:hypothetical protein